MRVFLASPWIPAEWVRAHGLESHGLWFAEKFRQAAPALAAGVCAFAESAVEFAGAQEAAAVVFPSSCDQLRRGFDAAAFRGARAFLFNLPATTGSRLYRAELERLGHFLEDIGGSASSSETLGREAARMETARRHLRDAAPRAAARSLAECIARLHEGRFCQPTTAASSAGVPLALVGGPLSTADWKVLDAVEAVGGRIVLNATETGERSLCPVVEAHEDPFTALAEGYFQNITDVFQRPNTRLYSWLKPRLASRGARGIVLWCFTGCDLWRAEMQSLREAFQLPVLLIEADEAAGVSARDVNRLGAFVETLQ